MDQIDKAVAAANQAPAETHTQLTITISSTGRHVVISFPVDMTDSEALEFVGWIGTGLRQGLAAERVKRSGSRILVPAHVVRN